MESIEDRSVVQYVSTPKPDLKTAFEELWNQLDEREKARGDSRSHSAQGLP